MGFDGVMQGLGMLCQIVLIDLLLSGDNAVVIALACRSLPPEQKREVIFIGTLAGVVMRVLLTFAATFLLALPSLKLIGGFALIYIALKLLADQNDPEAHSALNKYANAKAELWSAVRVVVFADIVMSIDNVVGLAAVAQGNILFLIVGLLLSVPLLMYGSLFVSKLLNQYSILVPIVGAMLGWIAGDIAISDPLIADWVNTQSPALTFVVPLLCAVYVLYQGKILNEARPKLANSVDSSLPETIGRDTAIPVAPYSEVSAPTAQQSSQITHAKKTADFDFQQFLKSTLAFYRRKKVLVLAAAIALALILVFSLFGKAMMPAPTGLTRYECPGYEGPFSLYYHHAANHVQLRSGRHVVHGTLDSAGNVGNGKIVWEDNVSNTLGFAPPDSITEGDKSLTINGGYFVDIPCTVSP